MKLVFKASVIALAASIQAVKIEDRLPGVFVEPASGNILRMADCSEGTKCWYYTHQKSNIELTKKALAAEAEGKKTAYQVRLAATQADLAAKAAARAAVAKAALDKATAAKAALAKAALVKATAAKAAQQAAYTKATIETAQQAAAAKAAAAKAAVATKPAATNPAYAKAAQQAACGKGTNCWNFRNYSPSACGKGTKCYYYTNQGVIAKAAADPTNAAYTGPGSAAYTARKAAIANTAAWKATQVKAAAARAAGGFGCTMCSCSFYSGGVGGIYYANCWTMRNSYGPFMCYLPSSTKGVMTFRGHGNCPSNA